MEVTKFKISSSVHIVDLNGQHFNIRAISDSEHDVRNFQPIAREAEMYVGADYNTKAHVNSKFGIGLIDIVTFTAK